MLLLTGSAAISPAKRDALLENIRKICPSIASVDALWLHLVKCKSDARESQLSDDSSQFQKNLDHLLAYGDDSSTAGTAEAFRNQRNVVYVVPRPGSISPWSSKATDIALLCNLGEHIERIERGIVYVFTTVGGGSVEPQDIAIFSHLIHDRMTQIVTLASPDEDTLFSHNKPKPLHTVDLISVSNAAKGALVRANSELGLALSPDEIEYLVAAYISGPSPINRDPTDAELFMFAQVNSEHCRHKIFNASWSIDGITQDFSLFQMIRNTEKISSKGTISAYSDNAAVLEGSSAPRFAPTSSHHYQTHVEDMPILIKVETHNHPTAVSPYPGAATGSGGEIRDEGAVGRGSKPKAGLAGFTTSNLLIPGFVQPWESDFGKPSHIASALDIMLEAPLGASAFNNEFGRPALTGYFRTFSESVPASDGVRELRGYHKPIMIAGGYGNVRPEFALKTKISPGAKIVVLGGPGLLIGLGGGAASSQVSGASSAELDFASVQRDNAEMQRRCQQVIDACVSAAENPVQSIHDVGAGGISNALPELVHDSNLGAIFEIRDVPVADSSMSPMEIWCNESQERYVLAISPASGKLEEFEAIARRERCPFGVVGIATKEEELIVTDRLFGQDVIRLQMSTLFGKPPKMSRSDVTTNPPLITFDTSLKSYLPSITPSISDTISTVVDRVLRLPSVASKSFLITIGDRTITGLVTRDQMVGPFQVPVADVAVTRTSYGFEVISGEAMAMGERTPLALVDSAASARIAIAESLTNIIAASVPDLSRVKLSANWMSPASKAGEGARLYAAVKAVGIDLCPKLGMGVPVGKDSMSMSMKWKDEEGQKDISAPLSLIITAFSPVDDVGKTWTPELRSEDDTVLVFFDLALGKQRLGGSALAQVFKEIGHESPDVEDAAALKGFLEGCQKVKKHIPHAVLAYHDRSDGGLFTTILEMAFTGHIGVNVVLDSFGESPDFLAVLFNEELGAIMQIYKKDFTEVCSIFGASGFPSTLIHTLGGINRSDKVTFSHQSQIVFSKSRTDLHRMWAETSYRMQALRDNPSTSKEEFDLIADPSYSGLSYSLTFPPARPPSDLPYRPKVAILREQGVNGQIEMAWAFTAAGFDAIDVHMSDILSGAVTLSAFRGIAACGGFSYGDVLGAGKGWAHSVLLNDTARKQFSAFFLRPDSFTLAVCNGCQFLSHLRAIIPGTEDWPDFKPNQSERFEGRVCMVDVPDTTVNRVSVFLRDMVGSKLPVAVAHGEGRASFTSESHINNLESRGLVATRFVDSSGLPTTRYPLNPNGSPAGITGVQTPDGKVLAMMPHPERVTTMESNSWYPPQMASEWQGVGPWFQLFASARKWCE